jgi:cysteinyl-tRNA synthetase
MLLIHNSLSRKKDEFKPITPGKINLYVCGVTVYDHCHIGHARTYTSVDVIVRYLRWRGYEVRYVRNITDIDDKIIKRANENNETCVALTERFTTAMHDDFKRLNLLQPNDEPRATEYIPQMIELIKGMMENLHAYVASNGDVYFDIRSFPDYGCLSHHNLEELESGSRVDVVDVKRDPLDFVLWKLAKPGEPKWASPWGEGRPGWHLECSAMSMELLGKHFDLHAGGRDLIFPHHENEIAQAEAATGEKFVNTWMHTGFLQIDKEKMSKSLNNFVTIREALADNDPEVVRYFLLAAHYRSPLIYTADVLSQTSQALTRFYTALRFLPEGQKFENSTYEAKFIEAMDDDFNTPVAMSVLFELAHEIQRLRETDMTAAANHGALLKYLGNVLGLLQKNPDDYFKSGADNLDVEKIESLILARQAARADKNWSEADRIRKELTDMNVVLEDGANGPSWKAIKK